jgi:hypothetical protein
MKFVYQQQFITIDVLEDDTIESIGYTISEMIDSDVYLFGKQKVFYTSKQVYDKLIKPFGKIPQFHLRNFLLCFNQAVPLLDKENYTLEDLDSFVFEGWMDVPIGQTIPCAVDPSKVVNINEYTNIPIENEFRKLLLDYTPLLDDTVYVCSKRDFPLPLYFDHNFKKKQDILKEVFTLPMPNPSTEGITFLVCRLDPPEPISMPLNTIFQQLHVSEDLKMIQYHSGKEENILYKLFSIHEDLHGNKIPVLPLSEVIKHGQAYKNTVTVFFQDEVKYAFHENGSILFEFNSKQPFTIDKIDDHLHRHDDILNQVSGFMYASGYTYPIFKSIRQTTIVDLSYKIEFLVKKLNPHECSSLFFVNIGSSFRYCRVSMFYEGELIQELCITDYLNEVSQSSTIKKIKDLFHLTHEQASKLVSDAYDVISSTIKDGKKVSIKHRVGFPTMIVKSATDIFIKIDNIPSLHYLPCLHKNIKAYIALLTVPNTIKCVEEEIVVENFKIIRKRYDEDEEEPLEIEYEEPLEIEYEEPLEIEYEPLEIEYEQTGGGKNPDLIVNNPHFTIHRMKTVNHDYKGYTRDCPLSRRPIALLNESEIKKATDKNFNMYTYKDVPYICPKYWDMDEKTPLHENEVDKKRMIPDNKKGEIDPSSGQTIYKMNDGSDPYPGPLKKNGVCCFKTPVSKKETRKIIESKQYISTHPTSLGDVGKVSYLPKPLRSFFQLTEDCQLEPQNYLLRYGISPPHTFLQCIEACWSVSYPGKFTHETFLSSLLKVIRKKFSVYQNSNLIRHYETIEEFEKEFSKEKMDYTELWEIISDAMLVNLVIIRVPDDIHVEFICPTKMIEKNKIMIMIVEQNIQGKICFEPIIEHNVTKNSHSVLFEYYHPKLNPIFEQIISIYAKCTSESEQYRSNLVASLVYANLPKETSQVIQAHKCIGFSVDDVFIPCYPSAPLSIPIVEMPSSSYDNTLFILNKYASVIPCTPLYKVVDEKIKGVITETNSFVPCIPEPNHVSSLPTYPYRIQHEYMNIDKKKHKMYNKVEEYLYAACRRYLKEKVQKNPTMRKQLNAAIAKKEVGIDLVERILGQIQWVDKIEPDFLKELLRCKGYCSASDKLILPKRNLKTNEPNHYLSRLANELNHYSRISTFIVKPQLRMETVPFSVQEQEVILVHSMVKDYYHELTEPKRIPSNYDTANLEIQVKIYFKVEKIGNIIIE